MSATLSFKNVGIKTYDTDKVQNVDRTLSPIGIKTPIELSSDGSGFLKCHYNIGDQLQDNLRNLILTNFGERVALYAYGANLKPLLSNFVSEDDFNSEAMLRINTAVSKWMPFVQLEQFGSQPIFENNRYIGKIQVVVTYSIPKAQVFKKQLAITLFVM